MITCCLHIIKIEQHDIHRMTIIVFIVIGIIPVPSFWTGIFCTLHYPSTLSLKMASDEETVKAGVLKT